MVLRIEREILLLNTLDKTQDEYQHDRTDSRDDDAAQQTASHGYAQHTKRKPPTSAPTIPMMISPTTPKPPPFMISPASHPAINPIKINQMISIIHS